MISRRLACLLALIVFATGLASCAAQSRPASAPRIVSAEAPSKPAHRSANAHASLPLPTYEPDDLTDQQKVKLFKDFDASRAASQ